jgi:hypothetical protein
MKLLSLQTIYKGIQRVAQRFPVAMLVCVAGTGIGYYLVHNDPKSVLINILLVLTLGAPLYVAAVLFSEAKSLSQSAHWGIHSLILFFLIGYYFLLPDTAHATNDFYLRHAQWAIGFVLAVTFIPFLSQKQKDAIKRFWHYNRGLVFALALTIIWAGALQAGTSIAIASIDFLFDLSIDGEIYADVWVTILGIFSTLFFLSRLPEKAHAVKTTGEYPKEVRLFSQYVLVPLVTVYFLILYAYTIRILSSLAWPEGQLAWMIIGFSFLGVLTYLALFPLREKETWIRHFGTALFIAMIPQIGMLYWALSFRLFEYGFTENRYFVFVFGVWLLSIAIYYLVARIKDIRIIPISLFVIAVLTSFGPWGAFSVAEQSQVNRLEGILIESHLLEDGLYVPPVNEISEEDQVEINEIVRYLSNYHGLDAIEPWFGGEDLDRLEENKWQNSDAVIIEKFDLQIKYPYQVREYYSGIESFGFSTNDEQRSVAIDVSGYQYVVSIYYWDNLPSFHVDEVRYSLEIEQVEKELWLINEGERIGVFDLSEIMEIGRKANGGIVSQEDAIMTIENGQIRARFIVKNFYGEYANEEMNLYSLDGLLFLDLAL